MLRIPAGNPSAWTGPEGNNTWLLDGRVPTLVDAGVGRPDHIAAIERALEGRDLVQVLATHSHPDHVQGVPAIRAHWPDVMVRNVEPDRCSDGERITAGDTVLVAMHTPGHAPDHFCFFDENSRDLYCGDLARQGGTIVIPASNGGSLGTYLASLRRIRDLAPKRLLPGHGPIVDDVLPLIDGYLAHRAEREAQIVDALTAGLGTAEDIVARIYPGLDPALIRAAAESVLAHLIKLREEGRAGEDDERWKLSGY